MENKARLFFLLLYPDNEEHRKALTYISKHFSYVYILHDRDVFTDGEKKGELKKPHFHLILKVKNPRYISGIATEIKIEERFIEILKNFKASAKYLLHYGDPEKYQYSSDDLMGSLIPDVIKLIDDTSEDFKVVEFLNFLDSVDGYISYNTFIREVCARGYWSTVRRGGQIFTQLLYEHNSKYYMHDYEV